MNEFAKINKDDLYYINFDGFKQTNNFVDKIIAKLDKSILRDLCQDYRNGVSEERRRSLELINDKFPKLFPRITKIENLTDEDINILIERLCVYFDL